MRFHSLTLCGALAAMPALAGERPAAPLALEPLSTGLQGAGCSYAQGDDAPPLLVVDAGPGLAPDKPTARIRVAGREHALVAVQSPDRSRYTYRNEAYVVVARDFVETGPGCATNECEGSQYDAVLDITDGRSTATLTVRAHCGA